MTTSVQIVTGIKVNSQD